MVSSRVEIVSVLDPGLGIPGLPEIRSVRFEYHCGSGMAVDGGAEGMVIHNLDSYSSLFRLQTAEKRRGGEEEKSERGEVKKRRRREGGKRERGVKE